MKYRVKSPIKHNGKRYIDGEIELSEKHARPLLAVGAVEGPVDSSPADAAANTWDFLSETQFDALIEAGFTTALAVEGATDAELLAVPGIGKAALKRIRKALA